MSNKSEKMFERLKKVIQSNMPDLDISSVTIDSKLIEDLGMDSIRMMMLAMSIEDEFKVQFNEPVFFKTVKEVLDYLEKNGK